MEEEDVKARLEKLRDTMMPTAKQMIDEGRELTPVVFGLRADGGIICVGTEFSTLEEKREAYRQIGKLLREEHHCIGAVTLNEAWYVVRNKRDPDESEKDFERRMRAEAPPSKQSDRRECVVAMCCTYGSTVAVNYPFRREGGKIVWEEKDDLGGAVEQYLFPAYEKAH